MKILKKKEKINLFSKKGVSPYDYMDSFEKFRENCLPPKSSLYSILNNENISDEDYSHAQNVWSTFKCKL